MSATKARKRAKTSAAHGRDDAPTVPKSMRDWMRGGVARRFQPAPDWYAFARLVMAPWKERLAARITGIVFGAERTLSHDEAYAVERFIDRELAMLAELDFVPELASDR